MECLNDLVSPIISPLYNLTLRHAVYLFTAGKNVEDLQEATEDLLAKSEDVQRQIEIASRQGKSATNEVRRWQEKVDEIKSEKEIICSEYDQRYKIFGCCSLNFWSNYNISKNASKKVLDAKDCLSSTPSEIAVQQMPPAVGEMPCASTTLQPTREINLQKALKCIKNKPVGMIGIWGPGGVGKTHLLMNINNSFVGDTYFDHVVLVTASAGCSVRKIQEEIVKKLSLRKEDDVGSQANIISEFLKERSFLILLDDLWERIDLQAVGIPYHLGSANQPKRKVVLTTRSKNVCGLMEVREEIKVACLREDEAWQLFQEKVGQKTLSSSPRIEPLARELVKELQGLPLALITIGRAMYPKSDPGEWEFAIHHMRKSCCDKDDPLSMESVFRQLKFSYDSLRNDTLRQCFLTCALFPEDCLIVKDELARCWMGLGLVDEYDMQSSYRKAHSLIGDLKAACLLEIGEYLDKCLVDESDVFVKMHDVVRDMALWISCGCGENNDKWVVHAGVGTDLSRNTIPWSKAECVSLMRNAMEELPPFGLNACPTKLRTLDLQYNYLDHRIFGTIKNFTALTYLDLRGNRLRNIPDELCALVNLEHLDLSENSSLEEVPSRFANLIKLKFLYLRRTCIRTIPKEVISSLKALQVFDLSNTWGKRGHVNYVPSIFQELGTLANLKAVGIDVEGVAEYELLSGAHIPIRSLKLDLEGASAFCLSGGPFSNDLVRRTLHYLEIQSSSMEQIIIHEDGEPNFHFDALDSLKFIWLRSLRVITWKGISPKDVFPRLTHLDVVMCSQLEHVSLAMYLPCLEILEVRSCENMKQAFQSIENHGLKMCSGQESSMTLLDTFPCLKFLTLKHVSNLTSICNSDVTFPSLVCLHIEDCPNLKGLPFRMQNLPRKLKVFGIDPELWDRLEWEEGVKSFLQHRVRYNYTRDNRGWDEAIPDLDLFGLESAGTGRSHFGEYPGNIPLN